ncbi:MAG TPA: sugar ABC transporter permease [Clostridiaceae bacterium]
MSYKKQKTMIIVIFLFIPLILLATFSYFPALRLIQFSFTDWDGLGGSLHYIGFKNYIEALTTPKLWLTFQNNLAYIGVAIIQTFLGLYLAIIVNSKIKGKNFFRASLFMPYILNGVAIAFMFSFFYDYTNGPINIVLRYLTHGKFAIRFLSENYSTNISLGMIGMWRYTGGAMVIFIGALQSVSTDFFEAAELDGANFWHKVRYIIVPNLKIIIQLNLFLAVNGGLQAFFEPFVLTKGGPAGRTDTFVTSTYYTAFQFSNFGKASSMGVLLMIIIILVLVIQRFALRGRED